MTFFYGLLGMVDERELIDLNSIQEFFGVSVEILVIFRFLLRNIQHSHYLLLHASMYV